MRFGIVLLASLLMCGPAAALDTVAINGTPTGDEVSPIDARTLERDSRTVVMGTPQAIDASPDGTTLALAEWGRPRYPSGAIRFVEVDTWRFSLPEIPLPSQPVGVYWTERDRLLVATQNSPAEQASVYVLEPGRTAPVARHPLDHTAVTGEKVGRYYAVLDADQRVDAGERDTSVVRIYSASGRELRSVDLGRHTGFDSDSMTAYAGHLYVAAGRRYFRIDPRTGRSRHYRVGRRSPPMYEWLATTRVHLAGIARDRPMTVSVFSRRSGRRLARRTYAGAYPIGYGSGWAAYRSDDRGMTGHAAGGRRTWRALRSLRVIFVRQVRRYLYVDDGTQTLRAVDKRNGRIVGRARLRAYEYVAPADRDGAFLQAVEDDGDAFDS